MAVRRRAGLLAFVSTATTVAAMVHAGPSGAASAVQLMNPPIDGTNCYYANTWMAPRSGTRRHEGVDIIAKAGTELYAPMSGRVVRSQGSLAGNQVKIVAADGTYFIYAHLSAYADATAPHGATVAAGTVIGYVGKTGDTTVNHLHFEVHPSGGKAVDPTPVVAAVNTCGAKVAQRAVANPSPWANVTTTTVSKTATTVARPATTAPTTTTVATTVATTTTTVAPTTVAPTTTSAPTTAPPTTAPPTTAAPTTGPSTSAPTTPSTDQKKTGGGPRTFNPAVVALQLDSQISANRTIGVKVVGFPGISPSAKTVTLSVTLTGAADGQAAIWPCGQKAGLASGTALDPVVKDTAVSSKVTLAPGDRGRVCLVSSVKTTVRVAVSAVG